MSNEKFNKNLDQVIEEEEINRYLKGLLLISKRTAFKNHSKSLILRSTI